MRLACSKQVRDAGGGEAANEKRGIENLGEWLDAGIGGVATGETEGERDGEKGRRKEMKQGNTDVTRGFEREREREGDGERVRVLASHYAGSL